MNLRIFSDLVSKEKRNKERVKQPQKLALGIGIIAALGGVLGFSIALKLRKKTREDAEKTENTVENIEDKVRGNSVKYSADQPIRNKSK